MIVPNKHRVISISILNEWLCDEFLQYCYTDASFQRLESVTLNDITVYRLVFMLAYLKSLPRLYSLSINLDYLEEPRFDDIYQLIFSFSTLRCNRLSFISEDDDYEVACFVPLLMNEKFSPIEYLVIDHKCTVNQLISLLQHTPRLRHLTVPGMSESDDDIIIGVPINLSQLTHISISIFHTEFSTFETFIGNISCHLRVLRIQLLENPEYVDAERWKRLITTSMPYLSKFYLDYDSFGCNHDEIVLYELIDDATSPFWSERHWISELCIKTFCISCSIRPQR